MKAPRPVRGFSSSLGDLMMLFQKHGLYTVSDSYFKRFPSSKWVDNKGEKRPYYYAISDSSGMLWMIPMTTQVENVRQKIAKEEAKRGKGNCIFYHIGKVAGKERGFKIGDMFPVSNQYIVKAYTINKQAYVIKTKSLTTEIDRKARIFLNMVENEVLKPSCDIMSIRTALLKDKKT